LHLNIYLQKFHEAAGKLDKKLLAKKQVEAAVGIYRNAVFLKLYKKAWTNQFEDPLTAASRIFFSVWINDSIVQEQKIFYNIHAFKLRKLKGYAIESRKFAAMFRSNFRPFEYKWPNVSMQFGPLTLMQGWIKFDTENFVTDVLNLAANFLETEYLIDNTLAYFKRPAP
jgi:hypothetical protein